MTAKLRFLHCPHHPTTTAHSVSRSLPKQNKKEFFQPQSYLRNFFSCFFDDKFFHSEKTGDLCMQKSPDIRVDKFADGVGVCWGGGRGNFAIFIIFSRTHTADELWQIFILKKFIVSTQTLKAHRRDSPNFLLLSHYRKLSRQHIDRFSVVLKAHSRLPRAALEALACLSSRCTSRFRLDVPCRAELFAQHQRRPRKKKVVLINFPLE